VLNDEDSAALERTLRADHNASPRLFDLDPTGLRPRRRSRLSQLAHSDGLPREAATGSPTSSLDMSAPAAGRGKALMRAPIARLPSNVLSPIRPPFMPPPAFAMARKGPLPSPATLPERPRLVPLTNSAVLADIRNASSSVDGHRWKVRKAFVYMMRLPVHDITAAPLAGPRFLILSRICSGRNTPPRLGRRRSTRRQQHRGGSCLGRSFS
jgi:hypothetical protein